MRRAVHRQCFLPPPLTFKHVPCGPTLCFACLLNSVRQPTPSLCVSLAGSPGRSKLGVLREPFLSFDQTATPMTKVWTRGGRCEICTYETNSRWSYSRLPTPPTHTYTYLPSVYITPSPICHRTFPKCLFPGSLHLLGFYGIEQHCPQAALLLAPRQSMHTLSSLGG